MRTFFVKLLTRTLPVVVLQEMLRTARTYIVSYHEVIAWLGFLDFAGKRHGYRRSCWLSTNINAFVSHSLTNWGFFKEFFITPRFFQLDTS